MTVRLVEPRVEQQTVVLERPQLQVLLEVAERVAIKRRARRRNLRRVEDRRDAA